MYRHATCECKFQPLTRKSIHAALNRWGVTGSKSTITRWNTPVFSLTANDQVEVALLEPRPGLWEAHNYNCDQSVIFLSDLELLGILHAWGVLHRIEAEDLPIIEGASTLEPHPVPCTIAAALALSLKHDLGVVAVGVDSLTLDKIGVIYLSVEGKQPIFYAQNASDEYEPCFFGDLDDVLFLHRRRLNPTFNFYDNLKDLGDEQDIAHTPPIFPDAVAPALALAR